MLQSTFDTYPARFIFGVFSIFYLIHTCVWKMNSTVDLLSLFDTLTTMTTYSILLLQQQFNVFSSLYCCCCCRNRHRYHLHHGRCLFVFFTLSHSLCPSLSHFFFTQLIVYILCAHYFGLDEIRDAHNI